MMPILKHLGRFQVVNQTKVLKLLKQYKSKNKRNIIENDSSHDIEKSVHIFAQINFLI